MNTVRDSMRLRNVALSAAKLALAVLVLYAAGSRLASDLVRLRHVEVSVFWLACSAVSYAAALACFGVYWRLVVRRLGGTIGSGEAQRAYIISQLGKYVPGKALVVVMRSALTRRDSVTLPVAVISTFYETVALMAVGSAVSLAVLAATGGATRSLILLAAALTAGLTAAVLPPVFSRAVSLVALPFGKRGEHLARPVTWSILVWAFALLSPGWLLMGLSVAAAAAGVGAPVEWPAGAMQAVGSAGLSTAGGFVMVFLPAGLGAREYLLTEILAPYVGPASAALTAVTARLVQVVVELVISAALLPFGKRYSAPASRVNVRGEEDTACSRVQRGG